MHSFLMQPSGKRVADLPGDKKEFSWEVLIANVFRPLSFLALSWESYRDHLDCTVKVGIGVGWSTLVKERYDFFKFL